MKLRRRLCTLTFFKNYPEPGGRHIDKDGFQVGIGGNGLDESGRGRWSAHVVGQNQAARPNQRQQPVQVINISLLVGIQKEKIDGLPETVYGFVSITLNYGDHTVDTGPDEIGPGHGRGLGIDLKGGEPAAGGVQAQAAGRAAC
jgi:hypothetical protein